MMRRSSGGRSDHAKFGAPQGGMLPGPLRVGSESHQKYGHMTDKEWLPDRCAGPPATLILKALRITEDGIASLAPEKEDLE